MALVAAFSSLESELDVLATELRAFAARRGPVAASNQFSLLDECLLEGLLSRVWQAWCNFSRTCVVHSCLGATTASALVPPLALATSEAHVSSAAIRAKNKANPPYWGATNTVLRAEPTWGDVDVLNKILTKLRPNNHTQLLSAFSTIYSSAKALQTIRNGVAHHNVQTMDKVRRLQSSYVVFRITHPTHALFWTEPSSNDFLVTFAIDELKVAALAAVA
jgi:hypothetical protein